MSFRRSFYGLVLFYALFYNKATSLSVKDKEVSLITVEILAQIRYNKIVMLAQNKRRLI